MRLTYLFLTYNIVNDAKLDLIIFHRNDIKLKNKGRFCVILLKIIQNILRKNGVGMEEEVLFLMICRIVKHWFLYYRSYILLCFLMS